MTTTYNVGNPGSALGKAQKITAISLMVLVQSVPITTKVSSLNPVHGGVLDTTLCNKFCQRLATVRWFSRDTLVSSTNKTDSHAITDILLKVVNQPN